VRLPITGCTIIIYIYLRIFVVFLKENYYFRTVSLEHLLYIRLDPCRYNTFHFTRIVYVSDRRWSCHRILFIRTHFTIIIHNLLTTDRGQHNILLRNLKGSLKIGLSADDFDMPATCTT